MSRPKEIVLTYDDCIAELRDAYKSVDDARADAEKLLKQLFAPGDSVTYRHGKHTRQAEVVAISEYGDQLRVRGATGSEYWITGRDLVQ